MDTTLSTFVASVLLVAACGATATALAARGEPSTQTATTCSTPTSAPHAAVAPKRNNGCSKRF